MQKLIFLSLVLFSVTACQAQDKQPQNRTETTVKQHTPQGNWTVHKRYDQNGNLIAMDSTYTYSYSSINGQPATSAQMDSLRQLMQQHFGTAFAMPNFPSVGGFANTPINIDSLRSRMFSQNAMPNIAEMQKQMRQQMRAMQQHFMQAMPQHPQRFIPREAPDPKATEKAPQPKQHAAETTPPNLPVHSI